jgi:hypothetical protein
MRAIIRSAIDALRTQPLALALVLVNVLYLAAGVFILKEVSESNKEERSLRNELMQRLPVGACQDRR